MFVMSIDKHQIRIRALELIQADGHRVGTRLAQAMGLSRQVANGYLQVLLRDGLVEAEGTTRARVYRLKWLVDIDRRYPREGLQEDLVWRELHRAEHGRVARQREQHLVLLIYRDDQQRHRSLGCGRGAGRDPAGCSPHGSRGFRQGRGDLRQDPRALGLHDPRESILELAKGKLTTDPEHHSGEGIFFTSPRSLIRSKIESHHLPFVTITAATIRSFKWVKTLRERGCRMHLANDSPPRFT